VQLNILVLSYVAAAAASGSVASIAWRRRHMVGARELALLMLAVGWWSVANAFEVSSLTRSTKIAWSVIAYPGIETAPVLYLLFVLSWTRQDAWLTRLRIGLLLVVPVVSVGMAATNEWHHLLWTNVTLIDAWGVTAIYEHGPWFGAEAAYAYGLVGVGLVALVVAIFRYPVAYAARIRLVIVGSLVPICASVLYASGLDAPVHADLSSIAFASAGFIGAWAVLRSHLLDIIPVAWATVVDSLADAVVLLDPEQRIGAFNQSATRLLGTGPDSVGQAFDQALQGLPGLVSVLAIEGDHEAEIPLTRAHFPPIGAEPHTNAILGTRWVNVRVAAIRDGRGRDSGRLVILREVTERRQMVETIRTLSHTDELTGLLNRRGFTTLAEQQLRTSVRTRNRLWLLFADVDALKEINDGYGHDAGDRALCEIAQLLRTGSFRDADLVARLGGDEFAILATEISPTDGADILQRVEDAVRRANETPGHEFELSLSTGIAIFDPEQPRTLDELIREADQLMYQAKNSRRAATSSRAASLPRPDPDRDG
jgi:diguanylate cyclase (GGDEF)-like protein